MISIFFEDANNNKAGKIYMSDKKNNSISTICILAAGSLWGTMGLFVRNLGVDGLTSVEIAFFRSVASSLLMLVWLMIFDRKSLKIKVKDIWCFVGTGLVSLTFFNICYFTTIQKTSLAVAAILLYTSPVFVILFSAVLFKEKLTVIKVIALAIAFIGCIFVTGVLSDSGLVMDGLGILIGIGSGIGYALYSIFGRYAIERGYTSVTISFYTFAFSSLGMFIASPIMSPIPGTVSKMMAGRTVIDVMLIVGIAIVATIMPYLLYTRGLEGVENGKAGIMASVEPVVASVLGIIVFKERLSVSTIIGVVLVLTAIVVLNLNIPIGINKKDCGNNHKRTQ